MNTMKRLTIVLAALILTTAWSATEAKEPPLKPVSKMTCKELGRESLINADACKGPAEWLDKNTCDPGKRADQVTDAWERKRCDRHR